MYSTSTTFWEEVYELRKKRLIGDNSGRIWKRADLHKYIGQKFAATTINTAPGNYSISMEGNEIGKSVENGQSPKAWRVGRGLFQLIEDPDDDPETQQAQMRRAMARAKELRENKGRSVTMDSQSPSVAQSSSVKTQV